MKQLAGKATEEQIRKELDRFLNVYKVSLPSAKSGILKKYGGTVSAGGAFVSGNAISKKIADLQGTEMNVDVTAKAIFSEKKEITARGVPKTIISGIIGDDTGTVPFTVWNSDAEIEKGQCYVFRGAYTKKWNDKIQLNIGVRGKVEAAPDTKFDVQGGSSAEAPLLKVGAITDQSRNVSVTGEVVSVDPRNITVKGEAKTVYGGIVADDTGKIQFTAWNDFKLEAGRVYTFKNAYIRSWKGIPQLNLGDRCEVTASDAKIAVAETENQHRRS